MWENYLNNDLNKAIEQDCNELKELGEFVQKLNNIVSNITGDSQVLDGLVIDRINIERIWNSVQPESQVDVTYYFSNSIQQKLTMFPFFRSFCTIYTAMIIYICSISLKYLIILCKSIRAIFNATRQKNSQNVMRN